MFSAKTKHSHLDQLIEDFTKWENATKELSKENTSLNSQIRTLTKHVQISQEAEKCAVEERNSLRSMVDKLQSILSKRCDLEDENRQLKEQIAQAK
ncbi:uncharacterized protein LOC114575019, partial [Exaiptasia diaphana]|uniref:Uncharacterized protein n=1 Tax=Exaiptasia diaphana TaxID=2652724 RepID=A0A913YID5_EXADI